MPEALLNSIAPLIPGLFLIFWLFRILRHRQNHFLYSFSLLTLLFREFQVLLILIAPNNRTSVFIDKACLLLQGLLVLGLVSIVRVRMPLKVEFDAYYSFQDDLETIRCFLNGERKQAIVFLSWIGVFGMIFVCSFTKLQPYCEPFWGLFTSFSYFMAASFLNNLDRGNVDRFISDRIDLQIMLYGLLGIMAFLITGGNHSYPEIITAIRVGSYFFEAYICHLYAGLIQNFEVEFENFEETKVSNLESTCEPGKEQDSGAETEIQIEMGEIQVKVDSVKEIDEVMES